ncbi:MAG: hypothetical protein CVT77_08655 [Alphaproteobacteria bacterium HGW-Alphaproteobacteria-16]|nr:MAG: hypothetical protein CVT77_08655 [Alphaproteobacteria bacterium HGW-Alphaproteobacteria-16]
MLGCTVSIAPVSCGNGCAAIPAMLPGMCALAPPRGAQPLRSARTRSNGGCTFAEHPDRPAPSARIIWHADLDPGTISVVAEPADPSDPDSLRIDRLASWLDIAVDAAGHEHVVLSDGWHHIRLDVEKGHLTGQEAVLLQYQLRGLESAESRLLPLRRLLDLCRHRRFARTLFPRDPGIDRGLAMLRVHDALSAGASQREIGEALFGTERVREDWGAGSDSLRSRVRRLVREAGAMARGGYRQLMRRRP